LVAVSVDPADILAPMAPLISPERLAADLDDPRLRIADVRWYLGQPERGRAEYEAAHVPGAVFIDLDRDLSSGGPGRHPEGGRHPLPEPAAFAQRMSELGFGSEHRIVAYDDLNGTVAARLWWMLDSLGHPDVSVLDGGLGAWRSLGLPLTTEAPSHPPARMDLADRWARTIDRDALRARLGAVPLLDLRVGERYRGEIEPVDRVPGHIPSAQNAPAAGSLRPDGRFLPPDELAARFRGLGVSGGEVVTYCGSGVTACHGALALRVAGLPDATLYPGSYSDWSAAGMPIATGPEPGSDLDGR
jgi:thiosulfate/3-mercaptopyruvate sulfurtransferase